MSMNPLPPQAYTKDTMLKAYAWVMNQPENIKELATTPDILVSLYLKAQRDGLESLERPSIQNFRDELKSLAGMMDHLDRPLAAAVPQQSQPTQHHQNPQQYPQPVHQPVQHSQQPMPEYRGSPSQHTHVHQQQQHHQQAPPPPSMNIQINNVSSMTTQNSSPLNQLDERTMKMIRDVKEGLNLSNDADAMRALIQLGYKSLKDLVSK